MRDPRMRDRRPPDPAAPPWRLADWLGAVRPEIPAETPCLDLALQAERLVEPVRCWGSVARAAPMPGTYHCYSYDYRFRNLTSRPWRLARAGPYAAVEPNFTLFVEMDDAEARALTLIKRRIAAAWQAAGVRVWVDLNVPDNLAHLNLIGVPVGWRSYATRAHRAVTAPWYVGLWRLACRHAMTEDVRFLVYGGGPRVRDLCRERGWHWAVEHSDRVRGRLHGRIPRGEAAQG